MNGIQKTVCLGLRHLADEVEKGVYGTGDDAFDNDDGEGGVAEKFLHDIHDHILDNMT